MKTPTKQNTIRSSTRIGIAYRPISDLKPDPKNARIHKPRQINLLAKSIESFGFNVPILIDGEGNVLAGHARLLACQKLGITEVPTIELAYLSADQVRAFMVADNRLSEIACWDDRLLGEQLKTLSSVDLNFDIESTGFTVGEIALRIEALDASPEFDPADALVTPSGPAVTQVDDLWQLGCHRLLCGNALDESAYLTLMSGYLAAVVFTDPPYNVKIDGHVGGNGAITHREFAMATGEMSSQQFTEFLTNAFACMAKHSRQGAIHFLCMDWRHLPEILAAGDAVYSELKNLCVWVKNQAGMGSFYRSQHELVLVYKSGNGSHQNNIQLGRFGRHRSNVWEYSGIQSMRHGEEGDLLALHPTVKPIRMVADAILDCSRRGDIVLDPFMGSGTTLLAAERTGRLCFGMELDPIYVDTAIQRWQQLTGEDAVHSASGQTFTQRQQNCLESSIPKPCPDQGAGHG
jgi:DNA methylase/ParB-like nuclease domain